MTIRRWSLRFPGDRDWDWDWDWDAGRLPAQLWETVRENWYLGFTSFGGPPSHFKIFRDKFVKLGWIDEQIYQELFSVCQTLSGPGSTKMLYCINLIRNGFLPAVLAFLLWSLPGALGMYGLAVGVSNISGGGLPRPVYALLSGLNAATVGIIALAGVQLARGAITDRLTRVLVFLGAAAGMLYNALWYFPVLMVLGGLATVVYDLRWLHAPAAAVAGFYRQLRGVGRRRRGRRPSEDEDVEIEMQLRETAAAAAEDSRDGHSGPGPAAAESSASTVINRPRPAALRAGPSVGGQKSPALPTTEQEAASTSVVVEDAESEARVVPPERRLNFSWRLGLLVIALFLASFVAVMVLRGVLPSKPLLYSLFANMYLAGTIIFGGGPVVIPLLREYVVAEGWVSPRDFLIGLAIIQGFPGPNFNFAVFLGALAAAGGGYSSAAGAVLGFVGIFVPGMALVHGTMGVWGAIRGRRGVKSAVRGVNAAAVGLIYTAVYRLWQIGWIDEGFEQGSSLANDPWWVVVTATSYVGGQWFGLQPPVAILLGAAMGLVRYGVVTA